MKTPTTDRRTNDSVLLGSLWGVLGCETASIVNASSSGLLIEANVCPVLDSVHSTDIQIGGAGVRVDSVVRHLQPVKTASFASVSEFIEPPTTIDKRDRAFNASEEHKGPSSDES